MDGSKDYEEYAKLLQWKNEINKSRYCMWRTIATISLAINGCVFGLLIGAIIFR